MTQFWIRFDYIRFKYIIIIIIKYREKEMQLVSHQKYNGFGLQILPSKPSFRAFQFVQIHYDRSRIPSEAQRTFK